MMRGLDVSTTRIRSAVVTGALGLSLGMAGIVGAQTPIASVACLPEASATPGASPAATVAATPAASPVVEERTGESVTDQAIIDSATSAVASCHTDAENLMVVDVIAYTDGTYGVIYQYQQGAQVFRATEVFQVDGDTWTAIERTMQSPETDEDTATASVKVGGETPVESATGSVPQTPALRVTTQNLGDAPVMVWAFQSSDPEIDPGTITGTANDLPDTLTEVGSIMVAGGETQDMLLLGLDQGTYVFVATDGTGAILGAGTLTIDEPIDTGL